MPIDHVLREDLNNQQYAVATDPASHILCLACAGSGKTTTLAYRAARLVDFGVDPHGIVAFTFTEKAAESLKRRIARSLSRAGFDGTMVGAMTIGTIHAFCQRVLGEMDARYRQFDVLDENRLRLYLVSRYAQLRLSAVRDDPQHATRRGNRPRYFDVIQEVSDSWKIMNDELLDPAEIAADDPILGAALDRLSHELDHDEFIDFSLMIRLVVDALNRNDGGALRATGPITHLMVDEYQDVNPSQERLIQALTRDADTLLVVGDDDQALYAWRGADVNNILTFADRYPDVSEHTLSHNYRSTPVIVESAEALAAAELGATRIAKDPSADDRPGSSHVGCHFFDTRADEAEWVATRIERLLGTRFQERDGAVRGLTPGDVAVLMRSTRSTGRSGQPRHAPFTEALAARGIPFSLKAGGGVFDRPQVSVLRESMELLRNGSPSRDVVRRLFDHSVLPAFPRADFGAVTTVFAHWGRLIHTPMGGARRRVYPQQLVHDLLEAYRIHESDFDNGVMADLGVFSRIMQDVESVYLSIDSAGRYGEILNFLANVAESGYDSGTDDVVSRPDVVTISTVHSVKGLEFPAVFIADVESARFPGPMRSYNKWMPAAAIQDALNRGAYASSMAEEARLFYTAMTRAERYLYVTGAESLPGGVKRWKRSLFAQRLTHDEIEADPDVIPPDLAPAAPIARRDETIVPTSYSEIRYYLRCPKDYQFRKSFGFSPSITAMFGFGRTVHTAITKLHEVYPLAVPTEDEARRLTEKVFHLKHVPPSGDPENRPGGYERARESAKEITASYVREYGDDFVTQRTIEVPFEVPVRQGVISGAIDLIIRTDNRGNILEASVIDFKALEGGEEPEFAEELQWTELALQVQLYAKAAREVLGENARTGAVHLLKDNRRVAVPVSAEAVEAAVSNVEWAIDRVIADDFPMRPDGKKCANCDFRQLCAQVPEDFVVGGHPPELHLPGGQNQSARAFDETDPGHARE